MTFLRTIHFICNPDVGTFNPIQVNCIQGIFFDMQLGSNALFQHKIVWQGKNLFMTWTSGDAPLKAVFAAVTSSVTRCWN